MGNIISTIRDEEDRFLEQHPRPALDLIQEYKYRETGTKANWTHDREKLTRRSKRWALKKKFNTAAYRFLTQRALINKKGHGDLPWEATDLLGAGSFGVVGLWQQIDPDTGRVLDSMAIKETLDDDPHAYMDMFKRKHPKEPIPTEALWMDFLSRRSSYIPNLRQLVHFKDMPSKWRFYMEFCPNGDLSDLLKIYKEFNDNHGKSDHQVIPEPYLWFCFYNMAQALQAMYLPKNTHAWIDRDLRHDVPDADKFILHLDIKHQNTLLGRSWKHKHLAGYPPAKMADFGLAQLTSVNHYRNAKKFLGMGTTVWHPPEQLDRGHFDCEWNDPIVHPRRDNTFPFDPRHGVWQIAAMVYGMATLTPNNLGLNKMLERLYKDTGAESYLRRRKFSLIGGQSPDIRKDYSHLLYETLDDCLNVDPDRRPYPEKLVLICEEGIRATARGLERTGGSAPPVFYGPNGKYELEDHVKRKKKAPERRERRRSELPGQGRRRRDSYMR